MKRILALLLVFLCLFGLVACNNEGDNIEEKDLLEDESMGGTVVAIDSDFLYYLYNRNGQSTENSEQQFKDYIADYFNQGITDLTINIFEQSSLVPSLKWTWLGDKINWKTENGVAVDYTNDPLVKSVYDYYKNGDCDPVDVMIRECKANGINPWITFRVNDAHYHGDQTAYIRGEEYYKYNGSGYMVYGNGNPYFNTCFNFENKEIRDHYLAYFKEMINRYDSYGVELDFLREIFCFEYWNNESSYYCNIMTNFLADVKNIIEEKEARVGRDIPLMIRVTKDIDNSITFGFDVETWIKRGIVDVIVPSPKLINDNMIDIASWVQLTRGTNVKVYAGQELNNSQTWGETPNTSETAKGYASVAYAEGAEKIYLSNFFTASDIRYLDNWKAVSSIKDTLSGVRRHVLTLSEETDYIPKGGKTSACVLPVILNSDQQIGIKTSKINNNDNVTIYCRILARTGIQAPELKINGIKATLSDNASGMYYQTNEGISLAYTLSGVQIPSGVQNITFTTEDGSRVKVLYLEVKVENNR